MQRSVLVVGDAEAKEFADAVTTLRELGECTFASADQLAGAIPGEPPVWIVLLQSRIGEFTAKQVAAVRRRYPLATVVAISGFWTAGELRTGQPLSGVMTIPWNVASRRLRALLSSPGELPPLTASPEEAIVRDLEKLESLSGLVVIATNRQSDFQYWADAVRSLGMSAVWRAPGEHIRAAEIAAVIYLPTDWGSPATADASRFLADHPAESRILGIGLPRWEDQQLADQVGFTAILGRPFRLRDLQLAISAAAETGNTAS
ncbi:hypothetical protein LOC68_03120 [Blastopirellula sp. JC732]|uniref:Uncharacterized protein n=1 Tax=Blastopirellula sediminis TaxID=2894196 RepID=A0A9X1MIV3_9BACT|nr:hypothetical protein [Blastopirellula sediminis]MCC9607831.1 hypothetical protein [Blastopirellula sediminis]MCC9627376.1 hypothetical protein [Blastopirellula sediminis]